MGASARRASARGRGAAPPGAGARWIAPALVAVLALVTYARVPAGSFTLDDLEIVRDNPRLADLSRAGSLWATDWWAHVRYADHALYRPLTLTTYALQRAAGADGPMPYHVLDVLLHAAASLALLGVARGVAGDARTALAAAALFAVHPVHVEAVAGIVGRAEILGLLGTLGAVAAARRALGARNGRAAAGWTAASAASCFLGAASKESAIMAPFVVAWTERVAPAARGAGAAGRRWRLATALAASTAALLALRARAVSGGSVSAIWEGVGAADRIRTALRVFGETVGLLVAPVRLSAEYGPAQVPIAHGIGPGVVLGAALLLGIAAAALLPVRRRPAVAWGAGVFLLLVLPLSNLVFPIGVAKAERILYAPSAGFLVAAAGALAALTARRPPVFAAITGALVLAGGAAAFARTADWRDNCTLAAATLRTAPDSGIFLVMHARCLRDAGDAAGARRVLEDALRADPALTGAALLLSEIEEAAGNPEESLRLSESVLAREPRHRVALSRSAVLLQRLGRTGPALGRFEEWRAEEPDDPRPWAGLVKAYFDAGQPRRGLETAREALRRFPNDALVQGNAAAAEAMAGGAAP